MQQQTGTLQPIGSIEQGWNLIKNDYWLFFGMTTLSTIAIIIVAIIASLIVGLIAVPINAIFGIAGGATSDSGRVALSIIPSIISEVLGVVSGTVIGTISGMFTCGIYIALSRRAANGFASFNDLFEGFKFFKEVFIVCLIVAVVNFVLRLIMVLAGAALGLGAIGSGIMGADGKPNLAVLGAFFGVFGVVVLIYSLIMLIVSVLTTFVYPLIADRQLSAFQAFNMSFSAALQNVFSIILLFILLALIMLAGFIACFIGIFFVAPIVTASIFTAYTQVFGLSGNNFNQYAPPPPPVFNNQPGF